MYACLYAPTAPAEEELITLASRFSPEIEVTSPQAVMFSMMGLSHLLGSLAQIAVAIQQAAETAPIRIQFAIASNPDSTLLLAQHCPGTVALTQEEEQAPLARLPIDVLLSHDPTIPASLLTLLQSWGVNHCGELAALPEQDLMERLGRAAVRLHRFARGQANRPLRLTPPPAGYEEFVHLEHPVEQRESLLFLLSSLLQNLCRRLQAQSQAARGVRIEFALETQPHLCEIEFAVPLSDYAAILKLLQLYLERHGPPSAVLAFTLRLLPTPARRLQQTLFDPPAPPADKLQVTLARIAVGIGPESVGCPQLLDTHRPDAFGLLPLPVDHHSVRTRQSRPPALFRLVLRRFRPPVTAQVLTKSGIPQFVQALSVRGTVRRCSGAWKTAGEWWAETAWSREEWDVELEDRALYRLSRERNTGQWYVEGVYD